MKDIKTIHKILLAIGLFCIAFGLVMQMILIKKITIDFDIFYYSIIILLGLTFLYLACLKKVSMWRFLLGLFFSFVGLFFFIADYCFTNYDILTLWPVIMSLAGLSIILAFVFSHKKITASILVPSLVLLLGGVLFLLFSIDVVKLSFISVVINLLPIILIVSGAILFGSFFYVQSGKQHISPEFIEDNDED